MAETHRQAVKEGAVRGEEKREGEGAREGGRKRGGTLLAMTSESH